MSATQEHYAALFRTLEDELGHLAGDTFTGIVGFSAGGPVSVVQVGSRKMYVTCELSLYEQQVPSSEGLRYELLCACQLSADESQSLLTALGTLSMNAELGHLHTIDVSSVTAALQCVQLQLHSRTEHDGQSFGIYRVSPAEAVGI